jgi:hypothetical protein
LSNASSTHGNEQQSELEQLKGYLRKYDNFDTGSAGALTGINAKPFLFTLHLVSSLDNCRKAVRSPWLHS